MRRIDSAIFACLLASLGLTAANAETAGYPTKTVTITNIYAVGGGTDLVARALGQKLSEKWKVPVIVESKPGAGGTLATAAVANAPADGYSLLITDVSYSIAPSVYAKLRYDPRNDLKPIILLNVVPQVMVLDPSIPARSLSELIAYSKADPGKLIYASTGAGSPNHLIVANFAARAGIQLTHVPYRGAVAALTDVVAGRVNMYIGALASTVPLIKSNKVVALAVMQKQRSQLLPNVPSIAEVGYPSVDAGSYYGIFAPAQTPPDVVEKLAADFSEALHAPEVRRVMDTLGNEIVGAGPKEFKKFLEADFGKWKAAAEVAGVQRQ